MIVSRKDLQSYFAEFLCTFIFGFAVYSVIINSNNIDDSGSNAVPLTVGFVGIVIIYTFLDHTVCHFNPAITLAAILTRKMNWLKGFFYILSQVTAFICAAIMTVACYPGGWSNVLGNLVPVKSNPDITDAQMFFSEFTLTAIFIFVVFSVAVNSKRDMDHTLRPDEPQVDRSIAAPIAIGLSLGFLSFLMSSSYSSSFNPGLVFAPMILHNKWEYSWILYVSQFTGGAFGAFVQVLLLFK